MGYIVNTSGDFGLHHINPTKEINMIHRLHWTQIDDGCEGMTVSEVDWARCAVGLKENLIREYAMAGYQPKRISYNEFNSASDKWLTRSFWVLWIISGIYLFFFISFSPINILTFGMAGLISYGCSIIVGAILAGIENCIKNSIKTKKKEKEREQEDFNNFIKGCRK